MPPSHHRPPAFADRIARRALDASFADFAPAVVEKARLCLIDFLSCALEARELPWSSQARAVAARGGRDFAMVGHGFTPSCGDAAFVNGVAGHGLVREDMHAGSIAHLGVVVWPALVAHAARQPMSGAQFLAAAIVGYEVGARLGRALMTAELARLFRPTGLIGAPAAVMAMANATGIGADEAVNAFSLATNAVSGLNQWPHTGGSEMYFHPGFAARNAVLAFDLARAGALASATILEGEAGLFAAYARRPLDEPIELFADPEPEIMAVFNKEVPACNFAQTPCQAALLAVKEVPAGAAITRVEIFVTGAAERYPGCNAFGPYDLALQAKMSIPFGVAATLARREIAETNYARLGDGEIERLIAVTELIVDPDLTAAFPARQGARVRLTLDSGATTERALDDVVPASPELIVDRFMTNACAAWGEDHAEAVRRYIFDMEAQTDLRALNAMLSRAAGTESDTGERA